MDVLCGEEQDVELSQYSGQIKETTKDPRENEERGAEDRTL